MRETILQKLAEIEEREQVTILHAVESGSRAWGFPSPDSDYDVRFFYMRPKAFYLRLDSPRDVIEVPIDAVLDINGWDLDKTFRLLHRGNPTLFEWSQSPVVYRTTELFQSFLPTIQAHFVAKSGLWHYLSMAKKNYRAYLLGETVRVKKYFYVLRPLLACRWILERGTPPPMAFSDLVETQLEPELRGVVEELLARKRATPELGLAPRIDVLNEFIERTLPLLRSQVEAMPPEPPKDWGALNSLFLSALEQPQKKLAE